VDADAPMFDPDPSAAVGHDGDAFVDDTAFVARRFCRVWT
jgi:hypothetical protein